MSISKLLTFFLMISLISVALAVPVLALSYSPGVTAGQYVKYGDFTSSGPGFESFANYAYLTLQVVSVSGKDVTLLSTGQFNNGTALPGNNTTSVWNVETGTENGVPRTQGPIIAANLNAGDAIPPLNTYTVNKTETETFLGVSRQVNVLNVAISTPDYNSTLTYVYDKNSGMLLYSASQTTTVAQPQPVTSEYSYSIVETNIFGSATQPSTTPQTQPTENMTTYYIIAGIAVAVFVIAIVALLASRKRQS